MTAESKISKARTRLLLDFPWYGSLAMRLRYEANPDIETFDVNGTVMRYNPTFAESLTDNQLMTVLAHEVMHCALLHPYRRANRDPKQWNEATDYAINGELVSAGFTLPDGALIDAQYNGLSADTIYARRAKKQKPQGTGSGNGQGKGQSKPNPTGTVEDSPNPESGNGQGQGQGQDTPESGQSKPGQMAESDWQIAAEQSNAIARAAGKMAGSLTELVKQSQKPVADWRAILREFLEYTVPTDYSWIHPNRRYIARGLYLPGITKENLGHIAIAVDTSGSIDTELLQVFATEVNAIVGESKPERVTVLYCDTRVNRTEEFSAEDSVTLTAVGRGGTYFQPVFDAVKDWESQPACLLYFTDLEPGDTPVEPEYPVLWVTGQSVTKEGIFGRTVRVSEYAR